MKMTRILRRLSLNIWNKERSLLLSFLQSPRPGGVCKKQKPDMCLVDWNMPDGQGDMLCRFIRSRWSDLPVIFLTVRGDAADIVAGFQYGADDYVVKPFELEVLYSRILALLRRAGNVSDQVLSCGSISINESRMAVFCGDDEIVVSQAEYQLLLILLRNKGKTVRRKSFFAGGLGQQWQLRK